MLDGVGRFITALPVQHFQFWNDDYAFVGNLASRSNECDLIGVGQREESFHESLVHGIPLAPFNDDFVWIHPF